MGIVKSRLCDWPPVFRDVVFVHQSGARSVGPLEKLEGDQGLQERCILASERTRREGGETASARDWRQPHRIVEGASGLHRCEEGGPVQAFNIPLLELFLVSFCVFFCFFVILSVLGEVCVAMPCRRSRDASIFSERFESSGE